MDLSFELWPKQALLLRSEATEILWGGAAGPGKSHGSRIALIAWCVSIPGLQCYLFRREYSDLIKNHMEGPTGFRSLLQPLVEAKRVIIREREIEFVEEGSKIFLCHCQHEKDVYGYQGAEMHVLILEEATQFTEFQIRYLRSRVRLPDVLAARIPDELKGRFPRIVYPTNPGGVGHAYLKRVLWEPAQKRSLYETWVAPDDDGGFIRQFIPAKLTDNPSVNPTEYAKRLKGIGSMQYVRALLDGDWSVILGAFFSELSEERHIIPNLLIPEHLFKFAWYDWGYSSPAGCIWFATSDGEAMWTDQDSQITLPRGALIAYRELYICNPDNPSQGAQMSNREQAKAILRASGKEQLAGYLADGRPFHSDGKALGSCPAQEFLEEGIRLVKGDTSRESGWSLVHSRLQSDPPMLYFCRSLKHTWRTMLSLQSSINKPEDADDGGEDHLPDCVRGGCTVRRAVREKTIPDEQIIQREWHKKPTIGGIMGQRGNGFFS